MYAFDLVRPTTLDEASAALTATGGKALAGGQSLISAMKLRLANPGTLVDLSRLEELKGIEMEGPQSSGFTSITIGALATHAEVAGSTLVGDQLPALAALAGGIGDRLVRNMGTLGGSIAHNDPAACYPAAVLALNATINTTSRNIAADEFFTGLFETALKPGELVTSVTFPIPTKAAYLKFPNPASRFALVGVFVALTTGGVRVAVTGAAACVFRATALEAALGMSFTSDAANQTKMDASRLSGDLHASPEYRAHLIPILASRAVAAAG